MRIMTRLPSAAMTEGLHALVQANTLKNLGEVRAVENSFVFKARWREDAMSSSARHIDAQAVCQTAPFLEKHASRSKESATQLQEHIGSRKKTESCPTIEEGDYVAA